MTKIMRNAVYYRWGGERGQHWCSRCYSNLGPEFTGLLGQRLQKTELERKVNDEVGFWFLHNYRANSLLFLLSADISGALG